MLPVEPQPQGASYEGRVGFVVGTGRSGTHFVHHLFEQEPGVASSHERDPLASAFHRYCRWYRLPVDDGGFLEMKRYGILKDLCTHDYSFEASGYLSASVDLLHRRFSAGSVLVVRRPDKVVASYIAKGLYSKVPHWEDYQCAPGIQHDQVRDHHSFSRLMPTDSQEVERWTALTQVGKIAWLWRAINSDVLDRFTSIPAGSYRVIRLEDLDLPAYQDLAAFIGIESRLTAKRFNATRSKGTHSYRPAYVAAKWTAAERSEFEAEVGGLADQLGYEWRITRLARESSPPPSRRGLLVRRRTRSQ